MTHDLEPDRQPLASPASRNRLRNRALLVSLIVIWAVSWPIIKVGIASVPPVWFGSIRYLIGMVCILPLVAYRRELALPPASDWPLVLVSAALQMGALSAFMAIALLTLPPGRASVLAYTTPLWVVPLAYWWLGERFTALAGLGVGAGLLGVLVIAAPSIAANGAEHATAYALLLAGSLAWAITIVYIRGHRFTASALALAPWQMLIASLMLLPFALWLEGPLPPIDGRGWAALAFVGPVSTGFAYWAVVEAGRHFTASTISMALLATPSLGICISALTLGEVVSVPLVAGVALIAVGIWLANQAGVRPTG